MALADIFAGTLAVAGMYANGAAVLAPSLAWGGVAVGYWLNRGRPLVSRVAGTVLAGTSGALVAYSWQTNAANVPNIDTMSLLKTVVIDVSGPAVDVFRLHELAYVLVFLLVYWPILLTLLLYVLARRYEEGCDAWMSRWRERRAERRRERAESRAFVPSTLDLSNLPPAAFDAAPSPAAPMVLEARAGEPLALPAGLTIDGELRPAVILVQVQAPSVALPVARRGSLSGFFVGSYYAAATVSKLWLPLALLGLWLFWSPLVAYAEQQIITMGSQMAGHLKPW